MPCRTRGVLGAALEGVCVRRCAWGPGCLGMWMCLQADLAGTVSGHVVGHEGRAFDGAFVEREIDLAGLKYVL